jgi:hypothetical protein
MANERIPLGGTWAFWVKVGIGAVILVLAVYLYFKLKDLFGWGSNMLDGIATKAKAKIDSAIGYVKDTGKAALKAITPDTSNIPIDELGGVTPNELAERSGYDTMPAEQAYDNAGHFFGGGTTPNTEENITDTSKW